MILMGLAYIIRTHAWAYLGRPLQLDPYFFCWNWSGRHVVHLIFFFKKNQTTLRLIKPRFWPQWLLKNQDLSFFDTKTSFSTHCLHKTPLKPL